MWKSILPLGLFLSFISRAALAQEEPDLVQDDTKQSVKEAKETTAEAAKNIVQDSLNSAEFYSLGVFERTGSYDAEILNQEFNETLQELRTALEDESFRETPDLERIRSLFVDVVAVLDRVEHLERDGRILEWHENAAIAIIGIGGVGVVSNGVGWMTRASIYDRARGIRVNEVVPSGSKALAIETVQDGSESTRAVVKAKRHVRNLPLHHHRFWTIASLGVTGLGIGYERYVEAHQRKIQDLIARSIDQRIEIYESLIELNSALVGNNLGSVIDEYPELSLPEIIESLKSTRDFILSHESD